MLNHDYLGPMDELGDDRFDLLYPPEIRELSLRHWTPVSVARRAAEFLVPTPGTRVLDIGCGPGKFCIVGALTTQGQFTGIEQRERLCGLARQAIADSGAPNAVIIHGNAMDLDFSLFDNFYLFNPFEENLFTTQCIDSTVDLTQALYQRYTEFVASQLAMAPKGTRLVTYCGDCEEVPHGYRCEECVLDEKLKFWVKQRS